jgi:hypothetical protein
VALLAVEEVEAAGTCGGREVVHVFDAHNVAVEGVDTTFCDDAAWVCIPQPARANNKISMGTSLARMVVPLNMAMLIQERHSCLLLPSLRILSLFLLEEN